MVARTMEDFPVAVVDTRSIGVAAGLVVMEAVRQIEAGVPFSSLPVMLEITAKSISVFFAVRELSFLRAGGRISEAAYRLGSVLNIKPVFTCDEEGHYAVRKKARGWGRALDAEVALIEELARRYPKVRLAISCTAPAPTPMPTWRQSFAARLTTRWRSCGPTSPPRCWSTPAPSSSAWPSRDCRRETLPLPKPPSSRQTELSS